MKMFKAICYAKKSDGTISNHTTANHHIRQPPTYGTTGTAAMCVSYCDAASAEAHIGYTKLSNNEHVCITH